MKTENIVAAFRHASAPASRLAAWQSRHPARRLRELRERMAPATLADDRREAIAAEGPELSSPEAERPLLWSAVDGDEIREAYAGRIALDHHGWFSDNFEDETLETYAVRLERFPHLLFYAVRDSMNGDLRIALDEWEEIDFSDCESDYHVADAIRDAAKSLIRSYDSTTEDDAEESREYYRKDAAENEIAENRETLATLRRSIVALAREVRELCASPTAQRYPAAAQALRERLAEMLRERSDLISENLKLQASL